MRGVRIEGFGKEHAEIYGEFGRVPNTGYLVAERFFHPGDAFVDLQKPVEILALPIAGPWLTLKDAIEYAKAIKPKVCFPIHDGMLKYPGPIYRLPPQILEPLGVSFKMLQENTPIDF